MPKVSTDDPRPPYVQIADDLRATMDAGELTPGGRLPAGRALAEQYGVAAMTVQHAIRVLRREGRLTTWQGRGVFVAEPSPDRENAQAQQSPPSSDRIDVLEEKIREMDNRLLALEKPSRARKRSSQ